MGKKLKIEDIFLAAALSAALLLTVAFTVIHFVAPDTEAETLLSWKRGFDKMCAQMLSDAEKGVEKPVSSYRMYFLARDGYLEDFNRRYTIEAACQMLKTGVDRRFDVVFSDACILRASPSSENFTNLQFLKSVKNAKGKAQAVGQGNSREKMYEVVGLLTEWTRYLSKDENFDRNIHEMFTQEAWSCLVGRMEPGTVQSQTVCAGYSRAAYMVCRELDIPCVCIVGGLKSDDMNHMWNLVYADGRWLHLDVTNCSWEVGSDINIVDYDFDYGRYYADILAEKEKNQWRMDKYFLVPDSQAREYLIYDNEAVASAIEALYPELSDDYLKEIQ